MSKEIPFISEVPVIQIRKNIVIVSERSGADMAQRAMPIEVFALLLERGLDALRRHSKGEQNVLVDN